MRPPVIILCVMIITAVFFSSGSARALQPIDIMAKNPDKYFVRQGSAQCGPASFYIVFRYYGDNMNSYPFYYDSKGSPVDLGNKTDKDGIINEDSPVSLWVKGNDLSTNWNRLVGSIKNLYYKNEHGISERYYNIVESNDSITSMNEKYAEIQSNNFLKRIVPGFLNQNRPVIIHLKRKWPFPGHYIVVIGFDPVSGYVSYMDPSGDGREKFHTVLLKDFLNTSWYKGKSTAWWGGAGWSGRWVGFYHTK